ncbi:MAG: aldo/keto reductase [Candidatus Kapaibacterium sp.]
MTSFTNIGFGSYRIDNRIEEHFNSLKKAIESGITTIDTSANYSDGRSEILIGNILNDLVENGSMKREDFFLITKGGYMQGNNYNFALKKKEQGIPFPEVVEFDNGLWHCIHPDFLEDQINRQLYRLDQADKGYIDVYLLHNPEYFLKYARKNAYDKKEAAVIYYNRIKTAFEFLEEKVSEGKIKYYGISSNTFAESSIMFDFTSLERVYEIAVNISDSHHFKIIQLPFNLVESGAYFEKNQERNTKTVLEFANEHGITVIVNRPLNAITETGLIRLADFSAESFNREELLKYLEVIASMEDDFLTGAEANLFLEPEDFIILKSNLNFSEMLKKNWERFGSIEHLNDYIEFSFSYRLHALMDFFEEKVKDEHFTGRFDKYVKFVFKVLNLITNHYKEKADVRSKHFHSIIDKHIEKEFRQLTLSQKAVLVINSVPGVDCVLVGARKETYVDDIKQVIFSEKTKQYSEILSNIKEEVLKELE